MREKAAMESRIQPGPGVTLESKIKNLPDSRFYNLTVDKQGRIHRTLKKIKNAIRAAGSKTNYWLLKEEDEIFKKMMGGRK